MARALPAKAARPLVLDSPHSGRLYPADFNHSVSRRSLHRMEDGFVDLVFDDTPQQGVAFIHARFARSYIDPNRAEHDLDPQMIDGPWPGAAPSNKSALGVGLIFRRNLDGAPIYTAPLPVDQVRHRIEAYYRPYHRLLAATLAATERRFGAVWHLNCHSMPACAAAPAHHGRQESHRADFCLGDLHGKSCDPRFTQTVARRLTSMGYRVSINEPYAGAELIRRYGDPATGRHSLQIEINRALYMDERLHRPHDGLRPLRRSMNRLVAALADDLGADDLGADDLSGYPVLAAE